MHGTKGDWRSVCAPLETCTHIVHVCPPSLCDSQLTCSEVRQALQSMSSTRPRWQLLTHSPPTPHPTVLFVGGFLVQTLQLKSFSSYYYVLQLFGPSKLRQEVIIRGGQVIRRTIYQADSFGILTFQLQLLTNFCLFQKMLNAAV